MKSYSSTRFYPCHLFLVVLIFGVWATQNGYVAAQSPFSLKTRRETAFVAGSGIGLGTSWIIHKKMPALTPSDINRLNTQSVPGFERFVTRRYDLKAQNASDWMLYAGMAIPALLLINTDIRRDTRTTFPIIGEAVLLNLTITSLTKDIVRRPRPLVYNPNAPLSLKLEKDARQSFFSGHTSMVAAATFSSAAIWTAYHPASKWKPVIWATAATIPLTTGILRVRAGKHYVTDVATGFLVGAAIGWVVPKLHR